MIELTLYLSRLNQLFSNAASEPGWALTANIGKILLDKIAALGPDYWISDDVAIHKTASLDRHAIVKGPAIISQNCFIGAYSYLRGGVFLDENVSLGPGCEVKSSYIFSHSALGHFNFVGDSLLGSHVNMEAGAVIANHFNEREDKSITVFANGRSYPTGAKKFGAIVGDHSKIGANAVLSPGTILATHTVVGRLELVDQKPFPGFSA